MAASPAREAVRRHDDYPPTPGVDTVVGAVPVPFVRNTPFGKQIVYPNAFGLTDGAPAPSYVSGLTKDTATDQQVPAWSNPNLTFTPAYDPSTGLMSGLVPSGIGVTGPPATQIDPVTGQEVDPATGAPIGQSEPNLPKQIDWANAAPTWFDPYTGRPAKNPQAKVNPAGWLGSDIVQNAGMDPATYSSPIFTRQEYRAMAAATAHAFLAPDLAAEDAKAAGASNQAVKNIRGLMAGLGPETAGAVIDAQAQRYNRGWGSPQYGTAAPSTLVSQMDASELANLQVRLIQAGYMSSSDWGQYDKVLESMTGLMTNANLQGRPWKYVLDSVIAQRKSLGLVDSSMKATGSGGYTRTYTSTTLSTRGDARDLLRNAMQSELGRMPTAGEVDQMIGRLRAGERAQPQTQTVSVDASGNQTSTTSGGFSTGDANALVDSYIRKQHPAEYQGYQRLNYFNAFLDLVNGSGG